LGKKHHSRAPKGGGRPPLAHVRTWLGAGQESPPARHDSGRQISRRGQPAVTVTGALFVAGGVLEAALLLVSIAFSWTWGTYRPAPAAFVALIVVGAAAAAATAGLGRAMWRTNVQPVGQIQVSPTIAPPPVAEGRAVLALVLAIAGVVLVWPFGIFLGPAAFWVGVSAVRRTNRSPGLLTGGGRARAGAIIGAVISAMYLFWIFADVVAIFMFGSPIPAAP